MIAILRPMRLADRCLVGIAAVFAAVLVLEMLWPHPLRVAYEPRNTDAEPIPASGPPEPLSPIGAYRVLAERPLFTVNRQPYEPPPEPREQTPRPAPRVAPPTFELSAVITTPSAQIALLRSDRSPSPVKLETGQDIDGWTVAEIRSDGVVLRNGARALTVKLREDDSSHDTT